MQTTANSQIYVNSQDLLDKLNKEQKEAVCQKWGGSLVIAGAGSGKTTVLTKRVAWLLTELKQPAHSILAVTFTNKAAGEMKERLEKLVGAQTGKQLTIGTFHSICARLLRQEIENYTSPEGLKWKNNFAIYDETDSMSLVKDVIGKLNLDDQVYKPKEVRHRISALKNDGYTANQYSGEAKNYFDNKISEIFNNYQAALARNNALDFDDLILMFTDLLAQNEEVRERFRYRFRHILVDEFQDTNQSQYKMIRLIAPKEKAGATPQELEQTWNERSLMVVGDVDQSIYSWRKADFRIILGFQNDYQASRLIKLEENYRSTGTILDVANSIIKNNTERIDKVLRCNRGRGGKIRVHCGTDEIDEAYFIVEELKRLRARGIAYSDCTILYRTNAQSRAVEEVLVRSHVPYMMIGGTRFYERAEIKDVLSYLKLIYNPADSHSFLRSIGTPKRGLGKTSIEHLRDFADARNVTLIDAALDAHQITELGAKAAKGLQEFANQVINWQNMAQIMPVSDLLELVLKQSTLLAKLEEEANTSKDELAHGRVENVRELVAVAKEFEQMADEPTLEAFLTKISLVSDVDALKAGEDAVKLMTLHSAKGLEFQNVFLIGLEQGLLPHFRSINSGSAKEIEEERRLMYVGVTRAEERLYITYARKRASFVQGNFGSTNYTIPSIFLSEISPDLAMGLEIQPDIREVESTWGGGYPRRGGGSSDPEGGYDSFKDSDQQRGFGHQDRYGQRGNSSGGGYGQRSGGSSSGYGNSSNSSYGQRSGGSSGYGNSGNSYGQRAGGSSSYGQRGSSSNGSGSSGGYAQRGGGGGYSDRSSGGSGGSSSYGQRGGSTGGSMSGRPGQPPAKPRVLSRSGGNEQSAPTEERKSSVTPNANFERLKVGDKVMHTKFGIGEVNKVMGEGDKEIYAVKFESSGNRVLDPRLAKLVKLD